MTIEEKLNIAKWYAGLKETNNKTFMPLFFDTNRYLILRGGGGSGKSIFAGRKVLERVTSESGHRWLICRKVAKTLRESCFAQIMKQGYDFYSGAGMKVNKTDMSISFANGSKIIFAGLDDVEKLKSIYDITGIWIEEASELEEGDFNQLDIRLRTDFPHYLQMILSFNPVSITHWLKRRFFDVKDPRATVHNSTYKDNRFLTEESRKTLESFKDTDEYYYMVYCLNQWGVTGKTVFDGKAVSARLSTVQGQAVCAGEFEYDYDGGKISFIHWQEGGSGYIKIYTKPSPGRPYVIGADTAGDGGDYFTAQVLDNVTGEQVAVLRHQFDEDVFARQVYCLGMYYNTALVAVETNFSTYPVKELERLNYPKQYIRQTEDNYTGKLKPSFGFKTTSLTRPVIIAGLIKAVREGVSLINDQDTLSEMLTFVRNEKNRPEAERGAHDDCIMSLAIAHYIRPWQSFDVAPPDLGEVKWSASMLEDYERASLEEKEYLIKKWGKPKR